MKVFAATTTEEVDSTGNKITELGGPDAKLSDVYEAINWVIDIALNVAIIIGVIMILYSAFLYVSSFGKEEQAETAKKTLLWSIIGTVVVVLARFIVNIVDAALK